MHAWCCNGQSCRRFMLAYQPQCGPIITYAQPCPGFHMYRSSIQDEGLATLQARCKALQAKAEEMEIHASTVTMPRSGHTYIIVRMRHWSRRRSSAKSAASLLHWPSYGTVRSKTHASLSSLAPPAYRRFHHYKHCLGGAWAFPFRSLSYDENACITYALTRTAHSVCTGPHNIHCRGLCQAHRLQTLDYTARPLTQ